MKATREWLRANAEGYEVSDGTFGFAQLRHYTAEYREVGDGPPLILVPGLAGGFRLLSSLASELARHFRVISYQLRGEDDCFALRRQFGLTDLVNDLAEFIEWHQLERPAVVGVSFGGILALEFAARYPTRLGALAVQGVGARFEGGLLQRVAGLVLAQYPLPSDNPFVNQFFNLLFGCRQGPGPLFDFVTQRCWQTDQGVIAHRLRLVEEFDLTQRLDGIRVPALILRGERDVLVSERSLRDLCQGIEHAKLVRLSGCGHLACVTHPQSIAEELRCFLNN